MSQSEASNATATPAQPSFESQLDKKLSGTGGAPLSSDVASHASASYGRDLSSVRVHTDSESAQMAESKGFQAFSYGGDVFGKSSALDTGSDHGKHVMMHELAHVAQTGGQRAGGVHGKVEVGTATDAGDALEVDADKGAAAALSGQRYSVASAPLAVRGFGATSKDEKAIVHQNQTEVEAKKVGFSKDDASMIYAGNWERDMNQLLIPKIRAGHPALFTAMDLMHTLHFGFPIGGTLNAAPGKGGGKAAVAEFGGYDPVEHIDNPGGLTGADVNAQGGSALGSANAGSDGKAYADIDDRYKQQFEAMKAGLSESNHLVNPEEKHDAFKVDESGIPVYLLTSRTQLIKHLNDGLVQTAQGGDAATKQANYERGLRYAGESLHIMQDYYAHSNFVEIAMNILIDSKFNGTEVSKDGKGKSFIDTLNLSQLNPALADPKFTPQHLNSYVHGKGKDGKVNANQNMTTKPKGGREVMATGTFTLEDTIHSLKEKMDIVFNQLNPFEKGASEKGKRLMVWLQSNPTYFSFQPTEAAQFIGETMGAVVPAINKLGGVTQTLLKGHGHVAAAMEKGWGHVKSGWHSLWGDKEQAAADVAAGDKKAEQTEQESEARQKAVATFTTEWEKTSKALETGSLVSLYEFATGPGAGPKLSSLAKMIPIIGDNAAELVEKAVKAVKEFLRKHLEAAFHQCMLQIAAEVNAALAQYLGSSEVSDKTASTTMSQPTHTDIAKDFDSHQNGSEDKFSIIEEVGEFFHRVGGAKKGGQRLLDKARERFDAVMSKKTGVVEGLKGAANDVMSEVKGPEGEDGHHQHQHRHGGAWLATLADMMAHQSSNAILAAYKPLIEEARKGKKVDPTPVNKVVMTYYVHPADCQGLWQGAFMGFLSGNEHEALEIKKELARRVALPPTEQAPNDHATIGGENRHHEHDDGDNDHGYGKAGQEWNKKNEDEEKHEHEHEHDHN